MIKKLSTSENIPDLKKGTPVEFSGEFFTARDATFSQIFSDKNVNIDLKGKILYFCGPTPAPPGKIIGSCGPTTSSRMEPFFEDLGKMGVKGLVGKGQISDDSRKILEKYRVIYFSAVGGTGAFLSSCVISSDIFAFPELGTEAIYILQVKDFPAIAW